MSIETPVTIPSNGEIKRWFTQKAVIINGVRPNFNDEIEFPIESLVFFPKSAQRRTTVI